MISIIHKGANYGFPLREGNRGGDAGQRRRPPLPADDRLPVMIDGTRTAGTVAPTYPVIIWGHDLRGGDCAGSGYLYNGKSVPALRGKFVYNDITTGRIWYSDYKDMLAADDGNPKHDGEDVRSEDSVEQPQTVYDTMMPIVRTTFRAARQQGGKHERQRPRLGRARGRAACGRSGRRDVCLQQERRHDPAHRRRHAVQIAKPSGRAGL